MIRDLVFRFLAAVVIVAEVVALVMWARDGFRPWLVMLLALPGLLLVTPPAVLYVFKGPKRANELLVRLMRLVERAEGMIDAGVERIVKMPDEEIGAPPPESGADRAERLDAEHGGEG